MVGNLLSHIGQTVHRLLCRAGAFDMVRDDETGLWRAWQPGRYPGDADMPANRRKPAPPFIPPSEIVSENWENKKAFEFKSLTLSNGSIAYGFASSGEVKRGDPVNLVFIDETIQDSSHYAEYQSRLSDRKGRIFWSTYPFMNTPALIDLHRRAVQQRDDFDKGRRKTKDVENFVFKGSDSPFVDEDEKRKRREGWSLAEYRARDLGEFISDTILAYPEFDVNIHAADYGEDSPLNDKVTKALRANNYNAPDDWRVDLILDPGTTRPALLWVAIPPPSFWDEGEPYHVVLREMAIPRIDATTMAFHAKAADPTRVYVSFLGDSKAGDQTPMGFASTVFANYSDAFEKAGLRCLESGSLFMPGSTTWVTRSMALRKLMRRRMCGRPRLRIIGHLCPELVNQLGRLMKGVTKEDVLDKLAPGQVHDQTDCMEYYAAFNPGYVYPPAPEPAMDPVLRSYYHDQLLMDGLFGKGKADTSRQPIILGVPE
jgi:hypothetical protein